jgi:hypothetical protein
MAAALTVTISGADKLRANLAALTQAMQRRIMAASMRKAMNEVLKPAVVTASPAGTAKRKKVRKTRAGATLGPLRKSWQTRLVKTPTGVHMQLVPISKTRDAFYAKFLEFGWLAGRRITKREIKRSMESRANRLRKRTPVPAKPFAGPAAVATFAAVVDRTGTELAGRIDAEMKKRAR